MNRCQFLLVVSFFIRTAGLGNIHHSFVAATVAITNLEYSQNCLDFNYKPPIHMLLQWLNDLPMETDICGRVLGILRCVRDQLFFTLIAFINHNLYPMWANDYWLCRIFHPISIISFVLINVGKHASFKGSSRWKMNKSSIIFMGENYSPRLPLSKCENRLLRTD